MLIILCFNGEHKFFQKSPGIKFLYERATETFHLLAREAYFETEEKVSANYQPGRPPGLISQGHLDRVRLRQLHHKH